MLMATTNAAAKKTTVCTTVKSRTKIESTSNLPTPGQAKMVSVTTAPEMSWLKLTANSVKMGMEAFFRACFQSTVRLVIPFARTSLMASESKTSNMLERTIRICAATNSQPNVREG